MSSTPLARALASAVLVLASAAAQERPVFDAPLVAFPGTAAVHTVLDLDGNGRPDALSWWWGRSDFAYFDVKGFVNDGSARFREVFSYRVNRTWSGITRWAMDAGRFDRDARDDFVTWFNNEIRVYTTTATSQPRLLASWFTRQLPATPQDLTAADLDGDGLDDLIVFDGDLQLHRNTGNGFVLASTLSGAGPAKVADVDDDGRPDLIVGGGPRLQLVHYRGGRLVLGPVFTHQMPVGTAGTLSWTVGDVDGDRDDDVVVFGSAGQYVVFRHTGPDLFVAEALRAGGPATGLADIDGDGDLDGVCCAGGPPEIPNTRDSLIHISINDGTGVFRPAWTVRNIGADRLAGAIDLDGDGDTDLIAGRGVLLQEPGLYSRDPQPDYPAGLTSAHVTATDLDADGDPDFDAGLSGIVSNDGAGGLRARPLALPAPPEGAHWIGPGFLGDWDGDGAADLIVGEQRGSTLQMRKLTNRGFGAFVLGAPAAAAGVNFNESGQQLWFGPGHAADLDGDGDLDLIPRDDPCRVWRNEGRGTFTPGTVIAGGSVERVLDVDGDGHIDLVQRTSSEVRLLFGDGTGAFPSSLALPVTSARYGGNDFALVDLDHDGDLDLASVSGARSPTLYLQSSARQLTPIELLQAPLDSGPHDVRIHSGDLDGDGHADLLLYPAKDAGRASWVLRGDGRGSFATPYVQVVEADAVVDIDGDGDLDLIGDELTRNGTRRTGTRWQFGQPTPGLGGLAPGLGASGPVGPGDRVTTRVTCARGASAIALAWGTARAELPNLPLAGHVLYTYPVVTSTVLLASGSPDAAGAGGATLAYTVPASAVGVTLFQQAFALDGAANSGLAQTGGLRLTFGR